MSGFARSVADTLPKREFCPRTGQSGKIMVKKQLNCGDTPPFKGNEPLSNMVTVQARPVLGTPALGQRGS